MWLRVARRLLEAPARSGAPWPWPNLLKGWGPPGQSLVFARPSIFKPSGAIMPRPATMPFGLIRVLSFVFTFMYFGMYISKTFAAFLEENNVMTNQELEGDEGDGL